MGLIRCDVMIMTKKIAELIVKIIVVLGFIGAILLLFSATMLLTHLTAQGTTVIGESTQYTSPELASKINTTYILTSVLLIICAILIVVLNIFLLKLKNWARIIAIIGAVLAIVVSFFAAWWQTLISIVLDGAAVYFLGFNNNVKALFYTSSAKMQINKNLKKK